MKKLRSQSWIAAPGLAALLLIAAGTAATAAVDVTPEDVARVTTNIVCTCGSDGCPPTHLVRHCSCTTAQAMQREVASMLAAGKSDEEIYSFYVEKFGPAVKAAPNAEGFNLIGWVSPFAALLVGGAIVMLAYRKLRTAAPAAAPAGSQGAEIDDKYRELLKKELAE